MGRTYPWGSRCGSWVAAPGRRLAGAFEELGEAKHLLLVLLLEVLRRPEQRAHRRILGDRLGLTGVEPVEGALVQACEVAELQAAHLPATALHRRHGRAGHAERLGDGLLREPEVLPGLAQPRSHGGVFLVVLIRMDMLRLSHGRSPLESTALHRDPCTARRRMPPRRRSCGSGSRQST